MKLLISRIFLLFLPGKKRVEGAADVFDIEPADVGVDFGGAGAFVAEEFLDVAQVGAVFQEVSGERVPQGVYAHFLSDPGAVAGGVEDCLGGPDRKMLRWAPTGKEPGMDHDFFPVLFIRDLQTGGEHDIAVFVAFAGTDMEQAAAEIQVIHLKMDDLADAEAAGVGQADQEAVFDVRDVFD